MLNILFIINAFLTFGTFVLLTLMPEAISSTIGVHIDSSAYFTGYMLGASEFGIAIISFLGRKLTDLKAVRIISSGIIGFHVASAGAQLYQFAIGGSDSPGI